MRCPRLRVFTSAMLMVLGLPLHVRAQAQDRTAAEALFERGRELMRAEQYAEACPKFAESQRLDPATGTLLNLADCYEKSGRTASAWAAFREAAAVAHAAHQSRRAAVANERAAALKPNLLTVTIRVPQAARVQGLEVSLEGKPVREPMWGMPTPVDPATYTIEAAAPGHEPWTTTVTVAAGDQRAVEVTVQPLTPTATPPPKAGAAAAPSPARAPAPADTRPHDTGSSAGATYRTAGLLAAGVGLVGVGLGTYFGLVAQSKNEDSEARCRTSTLCDPDGVELRDEAFRAATISTIAFSVGVAGLGTGGVLWLAAPEEGNASARSGRRGVFVSIGGQF